MPDFITTDDGGWVFSFGAPEPPELPTEPTRATNYLEGPGKWDNYSDDVLYECEYLLREFFKSKQDDPHWKQQNPKYRKYTVGLMYEVLFGEKYDSYDSKSLVRGRRLSKLMTYYATRKQKEGCILGKQYKKTVYTLSLRRYKRLPPFSLKLRIPWLEEQGKVPTWHNMQLPKENLKVGHARNKKTDENMRRRREQAQAAYRERYKYRTH